MWTPKLELSLDLADRAIAIVASPPLAMLGWAICSMAGRVFRGQQHDDVAGRIMDGFVRLVCEELGLAIAFLAITACVCAVMPLRPARATLQFAARHVWHALFLLFGGGLIVAWACAIAFATFGR